MDEQDSANAGADQTRRDVLKTGVGLAAGMVAGSAFAAQGASHAGKPAFRVAVTGDFENLARNGVAWEGLGPDAEVVTFTKPFASSHEAVRALRDFDAITLMHERIPLGADVIGQLPRLKLIVFSGNRVENLDDKAATDRNVVICKSSPDFDVPKDAPGGESPCELTIALLMACMWHTGEATALVRQGGWSFRPGVPLRGKTLGVLGYGGVGRPVARTAVALGMQVLAFDRSLTDETARAEHVARADLDTLLKNSDVVSIHLPLNASTRGMIGERQFALMKDGVVLINTARAPIMDEQPFLAALRSGKIAMAGLDVFWQEPLPAHHPLKQMPNVVLTPHIGYATADTMAVRYRGLLETLSAWRQGRVIGRYTSKPA